MNEAESIYFYEALQKEANLVGLGVCIKEISFGHFKFCISSKIGVIFTSEKFSDIQAFLKGVTYERTNI